MTIDNEIPSFLVQNMFNARKGVIKNCIYNCNGLINGFPR